MCIMVNFWFGARRQTQRRVTFRQLAKLGEGF